MKRIAYLFAAALILVTGCKKEPKTVAVESVTVSPATLPLTEGESGTLTATVSPSNATDKTITWSSSNAQVATVANGKVTAVKAGTATITATAGGKKGTCTVTVSVATVAVTNISLDITEKELLVGETQQLTATVEPADATDPTVTWSTSDDKVATVARGLVTAVSEGTATITATAGGKNATCAITVLSTTPEAIDLGLSVKWADRNLGATDPTGAGGFYSWGETETKTNYAREYYKWYGNGTFPYEGNRLKAQDDAAAVNLGDKWRMPLVGEWEELINKCTLAWNAEKKVLEVTGPNGNKIVLPSPGFHHDTGYYDAAEGYYWTLDRYDTQTAYYITFNPEYTNYNWISWFWVYYALSIRPVYGDLPAPEAVVLNINKATRYPKGVVNLRATVYPTTAVNKALTWSSSNEAVATVNENGYVTVVGLGETTITVTTEEGGHTDQCVVTVEPTPEGAFTNFSAFNSSSETNPIFVLENDWSPGIYSCVVTRANGIVDFNGHTSTYLYMQNKDPEQSVTVRRGVISHRLDGDAGWYTLYRGKVTLEDMELYLDGSYTEFYTDGHVYTINGGYYSTITTHRKGEALGDVNIYDGTFEALWEVNPDAGNRQGVFTLYGGKYAFDPRDYKNPGYNSNAIVTINIAEGYSVKENPGKDKEQYPYIVTKD